MEQKLTSKIAHRQAGLCAAFMWQDEATEGSGDSTEVTSTSIIGTLPEEVNGSPVFIVHVDGVADSGFGYTYPVERDVTVKLQENGEPIVGIATEGEVAQARQHSEDETCAEYAKLMQDPTANQDRINKMNAWALEQELHFVAQPDKSYKLEQAPADMITAYQQAQAEAEEAEEERASIERQKERVAFLEGKVKELSHESHLTWMLLQQLQPQVVILEAAPPRQANGYQPRRPDDFLPAYTRERIDKCPGMLFSCPIVMWQVGLTLDKTRIVFVPDALYKPYERECMIAAGWSPEQQEEYYESISVENDEGEIETPDWPNPLERVGAWKARQVSHWTGETDVPELNYSVWANGTAG